MTEQTLSIETITPRTPLQEFWFYFKQNKGAVIGLTFILVVALISIFALGLHLLILSNKIVQPYCYHQLGMKAAIQLIYWVQMTLVEIFFLALFMVRAFLFLQVSLLSYYLAF